MSTREDVRIWAEGEQIAAYLYRPETGATVDEARPCVVMAHGFAGTRDDGLPDYAEAFQAAGYVVVLFDYRHFGASTGQPRQLLDIRRQHADYHTVIGWARRLDGVDPDRIVVWGSSYSGGHVLAVAAADPRIAAVIAQAPFTDALPTLREVPPRTAAALTAAGVRDQINAWRRRPAVLMPAVGEPGAVAAMTSPDAKAGLEAIVGPNSLWRNEFTARLMLRFPFYRPGTQTGALRMPVLICVCDRDAVTPPASTVKAAQRAPRGELRHYPYGHFDIYLDPQAKSDQLDFLDRVFSGVAA